jgi:hypothetical protein
MHWAETMPTAQLKSLESAFDADFRFAVTARHVFNIVNDLPRHAILLRAPGFR